jgi:hypothetical protein
MQARQVQMARPGSTHIEALAERGLLEFAVIDPGSVNFTRRGTKPASKPASTHLNCEAHIGMRSTLPRVTAFTLPSPSTIRGSPGPTPRSPVLPASKSSIASVRRCPDVSPFTSITGHQAREPIP